MKRFFNTSAKKIRQYFNFRRPVFCHLDYMDLVLENKRLLLISWKTAYANRLYIRPGNHSDGRAAGAAVYQLPSGTSRVQIVLKNIWRSGKKVIDLKNIPLDPETRRYLDAYFSNEPPFDVCFTPPVFTNSTIRLKPLLPSLLLHPQIRSFHISFQPSQFNDYVS
ncbi:hypothetical protein LL912_15810 [Niabella sp. CC-SYL272]|uniref:hypothetical protein n=1 Tax=Niabella agricola TaxID=2891571 RepID=UPI001F214444|nr:hypothetical protein [Niabella agricola]MCF3110250.1 hypothetical protein [Niabella agricola]